jgi:hypothetical protein
VILNSRYWSCCGSLLATPFGLLLGEPVSKGVQAIRASGIVDRVVRLAAGVLAGRQDVGSLAVNEASTRFTYEFCASTR